jgi:secretion/DNA translocation related TadE-like protein
MTGTTDTRTGAPRDPRDAAYGAQCRGACHEGERRVRDARGSATVLTLAFGAVALALGVTVALAAGLLMAGSRARTAADLAALAAVDAGAAGRPACAAAASVATANAARLVACEPDAYGRVTVVVETAWRAAWRPVRARARAAPGGARAAPGDDARAAPGGVRGAGAAVR